MNGMLMRKERRQEEGRRKGTKENEDLRSGRLKGLRRLARGARKCVNQRRKLKEVRDDAWREAGEREGGGQRRKSR